MTLLAFLVMRSPTTSLDEERYRERRRRNNEAVRRCRENKRARLSMRDEVTGRLQTDNVALRSKIDGLNYEVRALKSLLLSSPQARAQQVRNQFSNNITCSCSELIALISNFFLLKMLMQQDAKLEQPQRTEPEQVHREPSPPLPPIKPLPQYALPKKGIPRIPNHQLPPLKRRITLPPSYNPLANGNQVVPFEANVAATMN